MTREHKLSIVISFGLLIFVGMLVADHFSIASHREVASLGSNISTPPLISPTTLVDGPPPPNMQTEIAVETQNPIHVVRKGETLRSICVDFYGDSGLASVVASWNSLPNPNAIAVGTSLTLPSRSALITMSMPDNSHRDHRESPTSTPATSDMGSYTVVAGDTLSEIAQKVMGTAKKTQLLIEVNKDVMPHPDKIRPGMVLQFPL
mgnify:CR=1 FL=1